MVVSYCVCVMMPFVCCYVSIFFPLSISHTHFSSIAQAYSTYLMVVLSLDFIINQNLFVVRERAPPPSYIRAKKHTVYNLFCGKMWKMVNAIRFSIEYPGRAGSQCTARHSRMAHAKAHTHSVAIHMLIKLQRVREKHLNNTIWFVVNT